jgi:hypothetical protein
MAMNGAIFGLFWPFLSHFGVGGKKFFGLLFLIS